MLVTDYYNTLLKSGPFKYLDTQELDMIKKYSRVIQYPAGAVMAMQGKSSDGLYIILYGSAFMSAKMLGKKVTQIATLESGDFFGEISLIEKASATATVIARSQVKCLQLTTSYFAVLSLFFPGIRYKILKAITEMIILRIKYLHRDIVKIVQNLNLNTSHREHINRETASISFAAARIDLDELYNRSTFFKTFNQKEFNEILSHSDLIKVPNHCNLIREDEIKPICFIVIRGAVLATIHSDHQTAKLTVLAPINAIVNNSLIDKSSSVINYTTCERAILLRLTNEKLQALKTNHLQLWYKFFNSICDSFINLEICANRLLIRLNSESYRSSHHV